MSRMSVNTALSRLAQYGESTTSYGSGTERALHQIALTLAAEVQGLRGYSSPADVTNEPVPYVLAEPDSPAARLAASLAGAHSDVVGSEGIDDQTLRLHVRPDSAQRWQWWLRELGVPPEQVTYRDGCATAKGRTGGVRVRLVGQGVPDLMRAAMEVGSW